VRQLGLAALLLLVAALPAAAQEPGQQPVIVDSIAVDGLRRISRSTVIASAGIPLGEAVSFRDVQRAIAALYATGQFDDVRVYQGRAAGKEVLRVVLLERPMLTGWTVRGAEKVPTRRVRGRVQLLAGRPYDPAAAAQSRSSIDSLYKDEGYYLTDVSLEQVTLDDGSLQVVFHVVEGQRVKVSEVVVEGNEEIEDREIVGRMRIKPEGFWWWRNGDYSDDVLERDIRERIPLLYASKGYIDFQVQRDTLVVNEETGKGTLILHVREGDRYEVGTFEIVGNRNFSSEQIRFYYPFGRRSGGFLGIGGSDPDGPEVFDQADWDEATQRVRNLYMNNGYIYAQVQPAVQRRVTEDGTKVVDLRWQIVERQPAIVNKVEIRGNTVTHEDVIRRAVLIVPGDVMRQEALIQSYQRISNLGFFEQPLPIPSTEQANQQGDVNVVFHVRERHTGSVNFGASVGQGTGLGGFIGLDEPNLFGQGKRASVQWQFGRNINNFNISYTDPAIKGSLISGTITVHRSRLRYTVADLGQVNSRGGSLSMGFPLRGSRFTRLLVTYTIDQGDYTSSSLNNRFDCDGCVLSMLSLSVVRDTRVGLPFPTGGAMHRVTVGKGGGFLGGAGDFERATFEGRWYLPIARLGASDPMSAAAPMTVVMGLRGQVGAVWGDAGPHFRQLFSMGGVQFGLPLRGYDEFSITPFGFDPTASGQLADPSRSFGASYVALSGELGLRVSQSIYLNVFYDAGNVWSGPSQINPTRMFRGAGIGASLITPLGPIGIDYAYGWDRVDLLGNPDPRWKLHFRLGNIF
jgi:outer membrane protein insertion porin family